MWQDITLREVCKWYLSQFSDVAISDSLNELREYRNCCDYNKNVNDLHELVNESLIISEEIIKNLYV
jgi:hypothetical protein